MTASDLRRFCTTVPAAEQLLEQAMTKLTLSACASGRILKVARTIADRDRAGTIAAAHVAEAIQFRMPRPYASAGDAPERKDSASR